MTDRWMGPPVAERALEAARGAVARATADGTRPPGLVSVHRGVATPFSLYLKQQAKNAEKAGISFRPLSLREGGTPDDLAQVVSGLDHDPAVHAVLIEHPLPPEWDFGGAVDRLRPEKDVDGVGRVNLGALVRGHPIQAPAVARAALKIAQEYHAPLTGRRVTVLGRSETVGRPLALLLLSQGIDATVTVAHSKTTDLAAALAGAETIFSCVGRPGLLDRSNVPKGAAVIDIGLSTVPDPTKSSGVRAVGDADDAALEGWASAFTPVPGGVGPVTVACLMENTVRGWSRLEGVP